MDNEPANEFSTFESLENLRFADVMNLEEIQRLQDLFSDAFGVASLITNPDGTPITEPSNFCRLCNNIIRKTEKGCAHYYQSDAAVGSYSPSGPIVQKCLSGGLWDAGVSITVDNTHIANWLIGQIRSEESDENQILQYADKIGADKTEYIKALNDVPIMPLAQFEKISKMLFAFANQISDKAYKNYKLNNEILIREQTEKDLIQNHLLLNTIIESTTEAIYAKDLSGRYCTINEPGAKILGYKVSDIVGKTDFDLLPEEAALKFRKADEFVLAKEIGIEQEEYVIINGKKFVFLAYRTPWRDSNGRIVGIIGNSRDITEQKQFENILKDSERSLARAEQVAKIGNWKLDIESNHLYLSEGARLITGVNIDVSIDEFLQLTIEKDRMLLKQTFENLITKNNPYRIEYKIRRSSDGVIVDIHSIAEYDKEKKIVFGVIHDITERKKAEETLRNTNILLEKTIEQSPVPMILVSMPNALLKFANKASIELFGVQDEVSFKNTSIYDLKSTWADIDMAGTPNPKDAMPLFRCINGEKIENEERILLRKDGSIRYGLISSYPIYDDEGNIIAGYLIIMDITERKKIELALSESREKFLKIFDLAPVLISIIRLEDSVYVDLNSYSIGFTGYSREEVIGGKTHDIGWIDTEGRNKIRQLLEKNNKIDGLEQQFTMKNGTVTWGLVNGELIVLDNQKCLLIIITDITERKKIELLLKQKSEDYEVQNEEYLQLNEELTQTNEELFHAKEKAEESDRLKSAFLANMSHEIRTPMNGILGFTELLKEPQLTGETRQTYISIIEKSGTRMLNIINDIISISKIESGQMELKLSEANINEQIDYIYSFFKHEIEQKGIQFIVHKQLDDKESVISSDREKLYAILTNLVKNAIKFTNKGVIEVGYEKINNIIKFYVKDSGAGIPKSQKDIIFERFRQGSELLTRNYEGAGLGLSISKAYVEMLGGKIWVESIMDKGSTFYFTIPYDKDADRTEECYNTPFDDKKTIKKLKILIAEDDESSKILISIAVKSLGREIIKVDNGVDAVNACRNNPDIDLILMDNKMPLMDGYEATRQIRTFNKSVVIIAQTAFALAGDKEKAISAGCNDYISKLFNQRVLVEKISKYFYD